MCQDDNNTEFMTNVIFKFGIYLSLRGEQVMEKSSVILDNTSRQGLTNFALF